MCHMYICEQCEMLPTHLQSFYCVISTNINSFLSTTWFFSATCSFCLIRILLYVGEETLNIFHNHIILSIISCYHYTMIWIL